MRKVVLTLKEFEKYQVIKELVDNGGNKKRAAMQLNITVRQINRLIKAYKEKGKSAFRHGNHSKKPVHTLDKSISNSIILLYQNKYQGFNFKHFTEKLNEVENVNISYGTVYKLLMASEIISPRIRKSTRRKLCKARLEREKKITNKTPENEIELKISHEIALEDSHPRGEKPKYFGEVIEADGSIHRWFSKEKTCLHLSVDKATNTIVGGYFDTAETLNGYYNVLKQILEKYGIPFKFFTDNRTVFIYNGLNKNKRTPEKDVLTQFGYACKQLGITIETSSISQSKGLIERDNGTFQDRLVNELRLNNIITIEKANEYLINTFIPDFNKRFAHDYRNYESVFEISPDKEKINLTLAIVDIRKIDNGNSIKYKNKYYQPYVDNVLKCFKPKTECLVIKTFDNRLFATIDEQVTELRELKRNKKYSDEFDIIPIEKKEKKIYIPPMTHPWKAESFKRHRNRCHREKQYA